MKLTVKQKQLVKEYAQSLIKNRLNESTENDWGYNTSDEGEADANSVNVFTYKEPMGRDFTSGTFTGTAEELIQYLKKELKRDGEILKTINAAHTLKTNLKKELKLACKLNKIKYTEYESTGTDDEDEEDEGDYGVEPTPNQKKILDEILEEMKRKKLPIGSWPYFSDLDKIGLWEIYVANWGFNLTPQDINNMENIKKIFEQKYKNIHITYKIYETDQSHFENNKSVHYTVKVADFGVKFK